MSTSGGDHQSRFHVSLLQLVLVSLTLGAIAWLNVDFGGFVVDESPLSLVPYRPHGCPFAFLLVEEKRDRTPVEETSDYDEPEAEVLPYGGRRQLLPIGLFLNGLFWLGVVVLAWVIGDPPSVSRTTRDRLRNWKGRAGPRVRLAPGTRIPSPRPNGPCDDSQGQTEP